METGFRCGALTLIATACASPAVAGSQTRPGLTTGVAVWQPLPKGVYLNSIHHYGERETDPGSHGAGWTPYVFLQAEAKLLGGRVGLAVAPTVIDGVTRGRHASGFYNTYLAAQIAWTIGPDVSVGYRLGGYVPQHGGAANRFGTVEHRAGASYVHRSVDLTANLIYGHPGDDPLVRRAVAPDYVNADLTGMRRAGRWLVGAILFASMDVRRPDAAYRRQGQLAAGPLVGYDFGPFTVQAKVTSDLMERNYGGREQRLWLNLLVPLWRRPHASTAPAPDGRSG